MVTLERKTKATTSPSGTPAETRTQSATEPSSTNPLLMEQGNINTARDSAKKVADPLENGEFSPIIFERELSIDSLKYTHQSPQVRFSIKDGVDHNKIISAALSCVLNGPVGLSKITTFPGFTEQYSIRMCFDSLTHQGWNSLLEQIKSAIIAKNIVVPCKMMAMYSEYYPNEHVGRPVVRKYNY